MTGRDGYATADQALRTHGENSMKWHLFIGLACAGLLLTGRSNLTAKNANDEMPGLNKEVKLLCVEPGQTLEFEVDFKEVYDKAKPSSIQGLALWLHKEGSLFAFWTNVAIPNDPHGYDGHGGLVSPTKGGKGGTFTWKNDGKKPVLILVNAFQGQAANCTRLQLLNGNEIKKEFLFGGGIDDRYNKIYLTVKYVLPPPPPAEKKP
jgi:hypothetical protein